MLPRWKELRWPADIYLEGSDQHRGWFHSSLLVGIGTRGRAPFDQVLTHGFVVDEQGRKMSKSLGNTIAPQDVMKQSGADVLRLWVSMVDYREDIRLGKEILARVVEAYRKFRNVLRVLMANLYDFDPATDAVPRERHARNRSLGDGALRRGRDQDRRRLRRVRLPDRLSGGERVHHRGPERVLRRRHQGPDVYASAPSRTHAARVRPRCS